MSDFITASSTLSATVAPNFLTESALEAVRFHTINDGYPSLDRYFCRFSDMARPIPRKRHVMSVVVGEGDPCSQVQATGNCISYDESRDHIPIPIEAVPSFAIKGLSIGAFW